MGKVVLDALPIAESSCVGPQHRKPSFGAEASRVALIDQMLWGQLDEKAERGRVIERKPGRECRQVNRHDLVASLTRKKGRGEIDFGKAGRQQLAKMLGS